MTKTYSLDTCACVGIIRKNPSIRERFRNAASRGSEIVLSAMALLELEYGVNKSAMRDQSRKQLDAFLVGIPVVDFSKEDVALAGRLRAELTQRGDMIGPYDILIAAQAVKRGFTVVTSNSDAFGRVPGLSVEDWTR